MTLMDAPTYDAARERRHTIVVRVVVIAVFVLAAAGAFAAWWFWNWPEEHRVSVFMAAVESGDQAKAYGIWNQDPDWQQHPDRYKAYSFDRFEQDWGPASQYGQIRSHRFVLSRSWGNGVIIGVEINGGKSPVFLWVDRKTKTLSFSPVELYRPIWNSRWGVVAH